MRSWCPEGMALLNTWGLKDRLAGREYRRLGSRLCSPRVMLGFTVSKLQKVSNMTIDSRWLGAWGQV